MKLNLALPTEPFWLDFPDLGGVRVKVRPLTLAVTSAMESYVQRTIADAMREYLDRVATGAPTTDLPRWDDEHARAGQSAELMALAMARFGIVEWEGVGDQNDEPVTVTAASAEAFARQVGTRFVQAYQAGLAALAAEGNASGAALNGGSAPKAPTAMGANQVH